MKNKLLSIKLYSHNAMFSRYIQEKKITPNINLYFETELQDDYINEIYAFYNAIQKYMMFKPNEGNTKIMIGRLKPIKSFIQRYPQFNDFITKLKPENQQKIKNTVIFAEKYNNFIQSNEIKTLSPQELYKKLLKFNIEFYEMIGDKFERAIAVLKNKIDKIEGKL